MSSRFEGQPMALAEAMACGLPCVSFDCPSGPSLLLDGGRNGLLVENGNVGGLAEAMQQLMKNPDLRQSLGEQGQAFVREFLNADAVVARWERLFGELSRSEARQA
jgi:glycosyltransferase involved in cell wall biosynthesis